MKGWSFGLFGTYTEYRISEKGVMLFRVTSLTFWLSIIVVFFSVLLVMSGFNLLLGGTIRQAYAIWALVFTPIWVLIFLIRIRRVDGVPGKKSILTPQIIELDWKEVSEASLEGRRLTLRIDGDELGIRLMGSDVPRRWQAIQSAIMNQSQASA